VTAPVDRSLATASCPRCHTPFATDLAIQPRPPCPTYPAYQARWMLAPLLGVFAVALGLIAVSQLVAFFVWACGSFLTLAMGAWHAAIDRREKLAPPTTALPSAIAVPRRDRARRRLPPET
jgi:hypothetical protein